MIEEVQLTEEVSELLLKLSKDWEAENNLYGYRANTIEDIQDKKYF